MKAPRIFADLYSGAGGFTTGLVLALLDLGIDLDGCEFLAVNHWKIAIATHQANHPRARHFCADAYKLAPRDAVPGGRVELLMASPTCTFFSRARGGKPISRDQRYGRMTPTQVLRWCRDLDVRTLLVENVPEFQFWGPCDRAMGKPIKRKRGVYFRAWIRRLKKLGYRVQWRILRAADYGDATTRERFFLIARKDRKPIRWPDPTHSKKGTPDIFGFGSHRWRAAREIIDWSIPGRSILRRERQLSVKTLERIKTGAERFGWPRAFVVLLERLIRSEPLDAPLPALPGGVIPRALVFKMNLPGALVFQVNQGQKRQRNIRSVDDPLQTVVTRPSLGLATPFVVGNRSHNVPKDTSEPAPGFTTSPGGGICLVEPFMLPQRSDAPARSAEDPTPTLTTVARVGLVEPLVLNRHGENGGRNGRARGVDAPLPTATGSGAGYLVEPLQLALRAHANAKSLEEPLPTVCAGGSHLGLVEPLVLPQHGGGVAREVGAPLPTIATDGAHALIAPYYGASGCASVDAPLGTATTRDRFALVAPVTHADASHRARSVDEPLPTITAAPRGELACVVGAFGERLGQAPRVHSIEDPVPTICAQGRVPLAEGVVLQDGEVWIDILFRMLEPHELAAAMGFEGYAFTGNKTERTRQIGNAVPVRTARALVGSILEHERGRLHPPARGDVDREAPSS